MALVVRYPDDDCLRCSVAKGVLREDGDGVDASGTGPCALGAQFQIVRPQDYPVGRCIAIADFINWLIAGHAQARGGCAAASGSYFVVDHSIHHFVIRRPEHCGVH
jgi:hypothetical protein